MLLATIKALVKHGVLPPTGPILVILAGLVRARRQPKRGWWLAASGVMALVLLSMPVVAAFLIHCLDRTPAFDLANPTDAQAIVILGGGTRGHAPEYGGATLGTLTLQRVRYGARVARATGLPVLVSGGSAEGGAPAEAVLMRDALTQEFGIPVRWTEARSHNTHENAQYSARMLKASGVHRVILVVHSFDVPRASAEFNEAGIATVAAPTGIPPNVPTELGDFLPSPSGLQGSYYALYEILANALFRLAH